MSTLDVLKAMRKKSEGMIIDGYPITPALDEAITRFEQIDSAEYQNLCDSFDKLRSCCTKCEYVYGCDSCELCDTYKLMKIILQQIERRTTCNNVNIQDAEQQDKDTI